MNHTDDVKKRVAKINSIIEFLKDEIELVNIYITEYSESFNIRPETFFNDDELEGFEEAHNANQTNLFKANDILLSYNTHLVNLYLLKNRLKKVEMATLSPTYVRDEIVKDYLKKEELLMNSIRTNIKAISPEKLIRVDEELS